jgi:hypothetical protein
MKTHQARVDAEEWQMRVALLARTFQPVDGLISIAQADSHKWEVRRCDISLLGYVGKFQ